jgi:hypothetical protein
VRWTYRGKHRVEAAFKDQPEVAARLNAFFSMQVEKTAEYTRQEALQGKEEIQNKPSFSKLKTIVGLQKEQDDFLAELQKMKPKYRMVEIEKKERKFTARVTMT